jgi:hypothetical protein
MRAVPLVIALAACHRPPPAPEGLDASSRFLLREFYADDETVGAGLTGLLDWVDAEGIELVDVTATTENVDGFSLADLEPEDVANLPLVGDRDLTLATGAVGISQIACSPAEADAMLIRADQAVVFDGDFDAYERTYITDRAAFEAGSPFLDTDNAVQVTALGTTVPYDLVRDFRHGTFEVQGEELSVFMALAFVPEPATGDDGTTLQQNYGVEIAVQRPSEATFRLFANWTFVDSSLIGPDSPIWPTNMVNTMKHSAERMSSICTGEVELPSEDG